jgi:hypothetical protein
VFGDLVRIFGHPPNNMLLRSSPNSIQKLMPQKLVFGFSKKYWEKNKYTQLIPQQLPVHDCDLFLGCSVLNAGPANL